MVEGRTESMVGRGVSRQAVNYLGFEVMYNTYYDSLVKPSQVFMLKHNGIRKQNSAMCPRGKEPRIFGEQH